MQVSHLVSFGPFFPFPQRHYLYVYNHLHSVTPEGVYFYVPALGRGGGEWGCLCCLFVQGWTFVTLIWATGLRQLLHWAIAYPWIWKTRVYGDRVVEKLQNRFAGRTLLVLSVSVNWTQQSSSGLQEPVLLRIFSHLLSWHCSFLWSTKNLIERLIIISLPPGPFVMLMLFGF